MVFWSKRGSKEGKDAARPNASRKLLFYEGRKLFFSFYRDEKDAARANRSTRSLMTRKIGKKSHDDQPSLECICILRDIELEEVRSHKTAESCLKENLRWSRVEDQVRPKGMSMSRQEEKESSSSCDDSIGGIIYPPGLNVYSRKESTIDEMERRATSNPLKRTYMDERLSFLFFFFCYELEEEEWDLESRDSRIVSSRIGYSD
jgi:hypothetical protein